MKLTKESLVNLGFILTDEANQQRLDDLEIRGRFNGIEIGFYLTEEHEPGRSWGITLTHAKSLNHGVFGLGRAPLDAKGRAVYDKAFEQAFKATMARRPKE